MVLQSFALVHRELFCSTLEINLIFGHINVLFSNLIYDIFSKNFLGNMYRQELFSRIHKLYKLDFVHLCNHLHNTNKPGKNQRADFSWIHCGASRLVRINLVHQVFKNTWNLRYYDWKSYPVCYKSEFCYGLSCLCHYIYIYIYVYNPSPLHKSIRIIYMNKKLSSNLTQLPENGYTLETRSSNNIILSFTSSYIRLPLTELSTLGSISNA